jgi:type IX secretion system PorP/SprF family membrane protein
VNYLHKKFYIFGILIFILLNLNAQDIHFSQFYNTPLIINPAFTGNSDYNLRFGLNYRNQGKSISVPYKTYSAFIDAKLTPRFLKRGRFGIGGMFYNDRAGDGNLQSTTGMAFASYSKGFNRYNTFVGTIGIAIGFLNRSVNFSKLLFDNQWNGTSFDPSLPNNENFTDNSIFSIDFNFGALISYSFSKKIKVHIGSSLCHVNKPKTSFYESNNRLEHKLIIHGGLYYELNNKLNITPEFFYSTQSNTNEIIFGTNLLYGKKELKLNCGIWYRFSRDIIPLIGINYNKYNLSFSYDINISKLHYASNYCGGMEISLIRIFYINNRRTPCENFEYSY